LGEIRDYIAKDNPAAARRVIERLRAQARQLAATPGIGRSRQELRPELFSFPVGRHLLFYRPTARNRAGSCWCASFMVRATCRRSSAAPNPSCCGLPCLSVKIWWQSVAGLLPSEDDRR
jgi:plasmid stabilization system protein ParE